MAYIIPDDCVGCDACKPKCPTGAIKREKNQYRIEASLCNSCNGHYPEPQCVVACPFSYPVPLRAKKGRHKVDARTATSPDLFSNGKNTPFATAIVIWEACNLLAQRQSLPWRADASGKRFYQRQVNQGRGTITLSFAGHLAPEQARPRAGALALSAIEAIDIRAACLHLIYAAHATALEKPWEQEFVIDDRQIEKYLGLDKRKDLSKAAKLTLIKEIAQQPCAIGTSIKWPQQGQVKGFSIEESPLWQMVEIQHYFQEDTVGCKHLTGLTFKVRAGRWAQYFLNKQACKQRTAFYQYGTLPKSLLTAVMSVWQQHEGAARMMLWLLFKAKMGKEQRITVPTLMRVAYGEEKVTHACYHREERKRMLRTFESDLEALSHYGLKPVFDPVTYLPEIQPLWAKLGDIPDDAEEALDFWINDGGSDSRLTDSGPRGKWNLLMNARILWFELPPEWELAIPEFAKKKQRSAIVRGAKSRTVPALSGDQVIEARKSRGISQRDLAQMTGKSQSWIRDIENGRFQAKLEDQQVLRKVLGLA
ncbi:helix-turn-helix domain-containing protein [Kamptonema formosum]|uniref:helix-turn-helix domain-containing protein n=1 Tax=Kamptonema formosum TaxID=331992 RepID=UPI00034842DA|nr:helix-turn-helix domain-containing protein [Oscillatoria sp. PCC 10802]